MCIYFLLKPISFFIDFFIFIVVPLQLSPFSSPGAKALISKVAVFGGRSLREVSWCRRSWKLESSQWISAFVRRDSRELSLLSAALGGQTRQTRQEGSPQKLNCSAPWASQSLALWEVKCLLLQPFSGWYLFWSPSRGSQGAISWLWSGLGRRLGSLIILHRSSQTVLFSVSLFAPPSPDLKAFILGLPGSFRWMINCSA